MGEISTRSRVKSHRSIYKKLLLVAVFLVLILGAGLFAKNKWLEKHSTKVIQAENQKVNQSAADAALKELQKNPSSLPSGKFEPNKGDYFRSGNNTSNSGVKQ